MQSQDNMVNIFNVTYMCKLLSYNYSNQEGQVHIHVQVSLGPTN